MTKRVAGAHAAFFATIRTNVVVRRIEQRMSTPAMRARKPRFVHWFRLGNFRRPAKSFLPSPRIAANPCTSTTNPATFGPSRIQLIEWMSMLAVSLLAKWMGISKHAGSVRKAILVSRIAHVVSVISEKEMARIAARRIVAAMKDTLAFGYGSNQKFPCETMSENLTVRTVNFAADTDLAVAVLVSLSTPEPALTW
jgi:hypothetical protein